MDSSRLMSWTMTIIAPKIDTQTAAKIETIRTNTAATTLTTTTITTIATANNKSTDQRERRGRRTKTMTSNETKSTSAIIRLMAFITIVGVIVISIITDDISGATAPTTEPTIHTSGLFWGVDARTIGVQERREQMRCESDDDCTIANAICAAGRCHCRVGFVFNSLYTRCKRLILSKRLANGTYVDVEYI